jgi:hypothetical protein
MNERLSHSFLEIYFFYSHIILLLIQTITR